MDERLLLFIIHLNSLSNSSDFANKHPIRLQLRGATYFLFKQYESVFLICLFEHDVLSLQNDINRFECVNGIYSKSGN